MSVIQTIRDKYAALVIAIIALSLIGFILMDALVGGSKGARSGGTVVGKVNGQKIDYNDFEKKVTLQQQMYGMQNAQRSQIITNLWQQTVEEITLDQEYEKLGLQFTGKELSDVLFGDNPPQWLKNEFSDKETGEYKVNDAKKYISEIKKQKANANTEMFNEAYIQPTIKQGLRAKYTAMISQSVYVPKWLAEKSNADQNLVANFSYVTVPYSTIVDSTIKVSDDDVKAYMGKHKQMFKQDEETRTIAYVTFNAAPSSDDSSKVYDKINSLYQDLASSTDAETFLGRVGSETNFFNGYVLGSQMQVPNADSIKQLAVGQVFGPYIDGNNFTYAKMVDKRTMPDSAKVRHILIKTGDKGQIILDDSTAKQRIDSIARAIQSGADFNMMVLTRSDDDGSKGTQGEYTFTSQQFPNLSKEFAEVAFYGKVGDKKTVKVENQSYSGYHYIEVLQQKQIEPAYKVAYLSKAIVASQNTINEALNKAGQFAAASRTSKQFEENATKQNLTQIPASEIKPSDNNIQGLGENRQLVRWIYENETGKVSEPFDINDKYIVALVTGASEKGNMSLAKARPIAEPYIIKEKKAQQIIASKFKSAATIEAAATSAGTTFQRADSVSFAQPFIPAIGNEPMIIGAAFNKSLAGKVSEPIAGFTGVFVVKGETIFANANTTATADDLRKQMESQLKQMSFRSIDALKQAADIKDNRFNFY